MSTEKGHLMQHYWQKKELKDWVSGWTGLGGFGAGALWWAYQNHLEGLLAAPILRISACTGLGWTHECAFLTVSQVLLMTLLSHFGNHWFRELQLAVVAGVRRQGWQRRQRPEEWGCHCGGGGEPLAAFTEDSDGHPLTVWKDHFGWGVEDGSVGGGPVGGQKTKHVVDCSHPMRNEKHLEYRQEEERALELGG